MDGLPVIVRLLDPPLHEFLPSRFELEQERRERAERGEAPDESLARLEVAVGVGGAQPDAGLRGVRLGLIVPELYRIQVGAALEALRRRRQAGGDPRLEIMVPLVSTAEELRRVREMIDEERTAVFPDGEADIPVGTMIELPRAALLAGDIARVADFFSFGTNDLTQTTYGLSRDDAERSFLPFFLEEGIYPNNPFQTMDEDGVGRLVEIGTPARERRPIPALVVGLCGEHGGDPGLDRVLPPHRPRLRLLQPTADSGRRSGRCPGSARREQGQRLDLMSWVSDRTGPRSRPARRALPSGSGRVARVPTVEALQTMPVAGRSEAPGRVTRILGDPGL